MGAPDEDDILEKAHQIVLKHLERTAVDTKDLPDLIERVRSALARPIARGPASVPEGTPASYLAAAPVELAAAGDDRPVRLGDGGRGPAVEIEQSVHPKYIICLEDGRPFKMMKRWLRTQYEMTPEDYRAKWGLPADYPMIAPEFSKAKAAIAKGQGFGLRAPKPKPKGKGGPRKPKA